MEVWMKGKRFYRGLLSAALVSTFLFGNAAGAGTIAVYAGNEQNAAAQTTDASGLVDDIQDGVTLQCWNWSYSNIEANIPEIAEQGFSAIQTSPIQFCKESTKGRTQGSSWWLYYQPAGFYIDNTGTNALGTKAEFEDMCDTAHEYGIKVIVISVDDAWEHGSKALMVLLLPRYRYRSICAAME